MIMMKIQGVYGAWFDHVLINGRALHPRRSQAIINHSPDGFSWGYQGSGPAQLALAILLETPGVSAEQARALYIDFMNEHLVPLPNNGDFTLNLDVEDWAKGKQMTTGIAERMIPKPLDRGLGDVAVLRGQTMRDLVEHLQSAEEQGAYEMSFAIDGGLKVRINNQTWSVPLGTVER